MSKVYRQWVAEYQDQAWSLARYLLQDAGEAEDATQEAFIRLWRHRDNLEGDKVKPWLMKVTRNLCLDRLRRRRDESTLDEELLAGGDSPQADLDQQQTGHWLRRAIAGLREPYRTLVVLRDIQQHSYREVAQVTQLSPAQVKVYLHRARRQLREQLAEWKP